MTISTILNNNNLSVLIKSLKINPEQEKFLLDDLPKLDEKERVELLDMLKNVYLLNTEEAMAIDKIKKVSQ